MVRVNSNGWSVKGKWGQEIGIPKLTVLGITGSDLTKKAAG